MGASREEACHSLNNTYDADPETECPRAQGQAEL